MSLDVCTHSIAVIVVPRGETFLMKLRSGEHIGYLLSAALDGDVTLVLRGDDIHEVLVPFRVVGKSAVNEVGVYP